MTLSTKIKLSKTLEKLLYTNDVSKITVSQLVSTCGVSRQTFYNNFEDIYELLYWSHAMLIEGAVNTFWKEENFIEAFTTATTIMKDHYVFYKQFSQTEGINSFQNTFALKNIELSKIRIQKVTGKLPNQNVLFSLNLYWYGASKMIVNWINSGMYKSPKELSIQLYESLPSNLVCYWPKF